MKNSKKGISLIVLVITIIVIIILAAAVIITMSNNNPIDRANAAVEASDLAEVQSIYSMMYGAIAADVQSSLVVTPGAGGKLVGAKFALTGDATKKVYKKADGKFTTDSTGATEFEITADELGISTNKADKYLLDAKGKISVPTPSSAT